MRNMDTTVAPPTSSAAAANGSAPTPSGIALEPRYYTDPTLEAGRAGAHLRAHLAARRPRLPAEHHRQLHHRRRRQPARARRPRRQGRAARLPQRLPPSRLAAAERIGPVQGGDPLPLPRLDLQDGRVADRRARGHGLRREARQAVVEPHARARRGDVRPGVRQPRHRRGAAGRAGRGPAPAPGPVPDRDRSRRSRPRAAPSRPTGRWWPTTTSRATTSPSPTRA